MSESMELYLHEMECPMCGKTMADPKQLPCREWLCYDCVHGFQIANNIPEDQLVCPKCLVQFNISLGSRLRFLGR